MAMKNLTDAEIIESVKKGNQADYSILVERYKNKAFTMLKRMLKNDFEAEEILMDAFLKAYNNLGSFKFESKFSTWFYKIAYNTALSRISNSKRIIETQMASIDDVNYLESNYNADEYVSENSAELVQKVVNQLPEKNAAVITMFYLEEMTIEEISDVLNLSAANVKVILHRSRNLLRKLIEKKQLLREML
jgi:RNA polymerase sigma-70 factor (ECF subfamily)